MTKISRPSKSKPVEPSPEPDQRWCRTGTDIVGDLQVVWSVAADGYASGVIRKNGREVDFLEAPSLDELIALACRNADLPD